MGTDPSIGTNIHDWKDAVAPEIDDKFTIVMRS